MGEFWRTTTISSLICYHQKHDHWILLDPWERWVSKVHPELPHNVLRTAWGTYRCTTRASKGRSKRSMELRQRGSWNKRMFVKEKAPYMLHPIGSMYGIYLPWFTYIWTEITIGAGILTLHMYLSMGLVYLPWFTIIYRHLPTNVRWYLYGFSCR